MEVHTRPLQLGINARHPQIEDIDNLIQRLQQTAGKHHAHFDPSCLTRQHSTAASSVTGLPELPNGVVKRSPHSSAEKSPRRSTPTKTSAMDRRYSQQGMPMGMTPDSQEDESAYIVQQHHASHGMQPSTMFAQSLEDQQALLQQPSFEFNIWTADANQVASMNMPHPDTMDSFMRSGNHMLDNQVQSQNLSFSMSTTSGPDMSALNAAMHPAFSELAAMDNFTNVFQNNPQTIRSVDDGVYGQNEEAMLAQPMAIHRAGGGQPDHVLQLHAQAERMMQSPPDQSANVSRKSFSQEASSLSEDPAPPFGPSPEQSRSPSSSSASQEPLAEMVWQQHGFDQDSRRPSMTTDLAQNFTHVNIQGSQSAEDLAELHQVFRKPSLPNNRGTLAERRKQQLPIGINVQRPKNMTLGRAFSSSAINQMPNSNRYPTSPHATLRRNKSSNPVINGRIAKSGNGSARNSPMVASFNDNASLASSQVTPQPPLTTAVPTTQSLAPPSPHTHVPDCQSEMLPSSASTTMYTPGIHSGSMPTHSFQNTPITTPYGFNMQHQQQQMKVSNWPPASDVPQSAPAHMASFSRDMSPTHPIGSMPVTPQNFQFHNIPHQMPMFGRHMTQHHQIPVVPSQHSIPEQMAFIPPSHPDMMGAHFQNPYGHPHEMHEDPYLTHKLWMQLYTPQMPREMEVKLDSGCEKLRQEVSAGRATLVPMEMRGEYTFQNLTSTEMKKQLDKE